MFKQSYLFYVCFLLTTLNILHTTMPTTQIDIIISVHEYLEMNSVLWKGENEHFKRICSKFVGKTLWPQAFSWLSILRISHILWNWRIFFLRNFIKLDEKNYLDIFIENSARNIYVGFINGALSNYNAFYSPINGLISFLDSISTPTQSRVNIETTKLGKKW